MALPHFVILKNESPDDHQGWVVACNQFSGSLTYDVVDITEDSWLDNILSIPRIDCLLAKPGGLTAPFKQLYDERSIILAKELGYRIFPSLEEILIYENKRYLSYWLKAHRIPHPKTSVFYEKAEAVRFAGKISFPVVAKMNIGASGSGVEIISSKNSLLNYINQVFETGVSSRSGPRLDKGKIFNRIWDKVLHPAELMNRLSIYRSISADLQKGFVIIQEHIPHDFEWRVVRIGESYFAHKKIVKSGKASGHLIKGYETPPSSLLTFVKGITDRFQFYSQAIDIFETPQGYLVNEMQCIFGQSDPYQMLIDGKPGRYIFRNEKWCFEEGMFNTNKSYDLRIRSILSMLGSQDL